MRARQRWPRIHREFIGLCSNAEQGATHRGLRAATGGGFIPSAEPGEGKATFGFSTKCDTTLENGEVFGEVKGQLQYFDREADVKFHASLDESTFQVPSDVTDACVFLDEEEQEDKVGGDKRLSR